MLYDECIALRVGATQSVTVHGEAHAYTAMRTCAGRLLFFGPLTLSEIEYVLTVL